MSGLEVTHFSPMADLGLIVRKAPVIIAHPAKRKELSNSQQTLFTLLEKRFKRYVTGQQQSRSQNSRASREQKGHLPVSSLRAAAVCLPISSGRNCGREINESISARSTCNTRHRNKESVKHKGSSHFSNDDTISTSIETLSKMECAELAEHVVNRARNRLKRRPKQTLNQLPSFSNPATYLNVPYRSRHNSEDDIAMANCSNTTKISQGKLKTSFKLVSKSPRSDIEELEGQRSPSKIKSGSVFSRSTDSHSLTEEQGGDVSRIQSCMNAIYLSEKQSVKRTNTGIPHIPPTPVPAHSGYIPSTSKAKSQRQLKDRLFNTNSPSKEDDVEDKRKKLEAVTKLKAKQRAEIYALNAVMRDFEESKFEQFKSGKV